jgi:type II secretory pathway pseudopilin PulG
LRANHANQRGSAEGSGIAVERRMSLFASPRGFTLFETVIATGILVTTLAGIAQLFILGSHLTRQASTAGAALRVAQDKLEVLVGLPFDYDAAGNPITDPSLGISPPSSLDVDTAPFVDWINTSGEASANADDALFVRRWRVTSLAADVPDVIAVEVCVFRAPANQVTAAGAEACLSTARTRQP